MSPRDTYARDLATAAGTGAGEAVSRALKAESTASHAEARADVIEAQARLVKWIVAGSGSAVVAMFVWLVTEIRAVADHSAKRAEVVAEATVLRADRRIEDKLSAVAQEAARTALRERDQQIDRLAAATPQRATSAE